MRDPIQSITISHFKATCLAVLEQVRRTGRPILVTKRGEPIAEIIPPSPGKSGSPWMGSLRGSIRVTGDIVSPAADETDWEALR